VFVDCEIWSVSASGGTPTQLTDPSDGGFRFEPAFSPDGSEIVFAHWAGLDFMSPDGTHRMAFTTPPSGSIDETPAFSPDGKYVAFERLSYSSNNGQIMLAPVSDGSAPTPITAPAADESDSQPAFSPDGTQIAFTRFSTTTSKHVVDLVPVHGGQVRTISSDGQDASDPDWRPGPLASMPPALPQPQPLAPTPPSPKPAAAIARAPRLTSRSIRSKHGIARLLMACPANGHAPCAGTLTLEAKLAQRGASRPRMTTIGRATFTVQPGQIGAVGVRLSKAAKAALKSHRRLTITAKLTLPDGAVSSSTLKLIS
jgi:hypothetical protein